MPSISSGDDHECSETFITKAEALFYGENYDAENQASITVAQIRGADLYQRMYTIMPTTLPQLKSRLVEHYGGVMALIRLQRRMLTETPSAKQTPAEFAAAKYRLWYRIYKTEEPHWVRVTIERVSAILGRFCGFKTSPEFEELLNHLHVLEHYTESQETSRKNPTSGTARLWIKSLSAACLCSPTNELVRIWTLLDFGSAFNIIRRDII